MKTKISSGTIKQVAHKNCMNDANRSTVFSMAVQQLPRQAGLLAVSAAALMVNMQIVLAQTLPVKAKSIETQPAQQNALDQIWVTEDAVLLEPKLNASAPNKVAIKDGFISGKVNFNLYSNYSAFFTKAQLMIYAPKDIDLLSPLTVIDVPLGQAKPLVSQVNVEWDGKSKSGKPQVFKAGEFVQYVLRVTDSSGHWDETSPMSIQLVTDVELERSLEQLKGRTDLSAQLKSQEAGLSLEQYTITTKNFGSSNLAIQNIVLAGSQIRVRGQAIPAGMQLKINGQDVTIDADRKFTSEYLLPEGQYSFELEAKTDLGQTLQRKLPANVRGEYWFMVGIADLTYSENQYNGPIQALTEEDYERFNSKHTDGRLAFYLKGKIKGRYLLTAHADTLERNVSDLFNNFFKVDRSDILRRIDPEAYYPIYGDDSTNLRNVDTSGRLYVRLDWDKSSAVWGNVQTGFDSSSLANYNRQLYGAKLAYRSLSTTDLGAPKTQVSAFIADQQTAPGRSELLGTGGSLYFLRHTDIVPSSQTIKLEIRDKYTARVTASYDLKAGRDYEIDSFQGRVILTRPLLQISKDNNSSEIIHDQPQDGSNNYLVATYEYYPQEVLQTNISVGASARQWLGQNVAVGASIAKENRSGQDYQIEGVDLLLQKAKGTWIQVEHAQSQSSSAPIFFTSDGGLTYAQLVSKSTAQPSTGQLERIEGKATKVEARINSQELGWEGNAWKAAAWWRNTGEGFFGQHSSTLGKAQTNQGFEWIGNATDNVQLLMASKSVTSTDNIVPTATNKNLKEVNNEIKRSQLGLRWQAKSDLTLAGEAQYVSQNITDQSAVAAGLIGLTVTKRIWDKWELYVGAQTSFSEVNYENNTSATVGTRYAFDNASSVSLEYSEGTRGKALTASGEYKRNENHTIYGSLVYGPLSNSPTSSESLIASKSFNQQSGVTIGQRIQLTEKVRLVNEIQWLDDKNISGQINSAGLEYIPQTGWGFGANVQKGEVNNTEAATTVDRQAMSVSGTFNDSKINWASKLEHRQDQLQNVSNPNSVSPSSTSIENNQQTQWLATNRLSYKVSDDWRILGTANYSQTQTQGQQDNENAYLIDNSIGLVWRPRKGKLNLLAKYNFLYDLAPQGQQNTSSSAFDQKSHIISLEATYDLSANWELAGKVANRITSTRALRGEGEWFSNDAKYAAAQVRWHIGDKGTDSEGKSKNLFQGWSVMAEYRLLSVEKDGAKKGALITLDKEIDKNVRLGLGYNFTNFSADLTQLSYKNKGFFLNLLARF